MSMIHRHVLQGVPLCFAQPDGAFHRTTVWLESLLNVPTSKTFTMETYFVINSIIRFAELATVEAIADAMLDGLDGSERKNVKIIFGVNDRASADDKAEETEEFERKVNEAVNETRKKLQNKFGPDLIDLHPYIYNGEFKHGATRNDLLYAGATQNAIREFRKKKERNTFVSFQDADTGSRLTKDRRHIFKVIDETIEEYGLFPAMIGGGYRRSNPENEANQAFDDRVSRDMKFRDKLAKIHPMIPYIPEPNLYVDAELVFADKENPVNIKFGEGSSEYSAFGKQVASQIQKELTEAYKVKCNEAEKGENRDEVKNNLKIDAENNRHPNRGVSVLLDFENFNIETNLDRFVKKFNKSNGQTLPQDHLKAGSAVYLFKNRPDRNGTRISALHKKFSDKNNHLMPKMLIKHAKSYINYYSNKSTESHEPVRTMHLDTPATIGNEIKKHSKELGANPGQKFSLSISNKFDAPFDDVYFGVAPEKKGYVTQQLINAMLEMDPEYATIIRENMFLPAAGKLVQWQAMSSAERAGTSPDAFATGYGPEPEAFAEQAHTDGPLAAHRQAPAKDARRESDERSEAPRLSKRPRLDTTNDGHAHAHQATDAAVSPVAAQPDAGAGTHPSRRPHTVLPAVEQPHPDVTPNQGAHPTSAGQSGPRIRLHAKSSRDLGHGS